MSLSQAIQIAVTGLQTTQRALQTTSDNIANANTDGFTRKKVEFTNINLLGRGAGVEVSRISRSVNEFLLRQIRDTQGVTNNFEVRDKALQEIQLLFGTPESDHSISNGLTELKNAFEALALTPENQAMQFEAVGIARELALRVSELANNVQRLRAEADSEIARLTSLLDKGIQNVSQLNVQIARSITLNQETGSLQDARDRELEAISEIIDIQSTENNDGRVDMFTKGGRSLINGSISINVAHTASGSTNAVTQYLNPTDAGYPGAITGIFVNGSTAATDDITPEITGGQLNGLIDLRDEVLPNLQSELDQLATTLLNRVNSQHNTGTAFPPPTTLTGTHSFASTDTLTATGTIRISTIDRTTGNVVANYDSPGLNTITSVGALLTSINGALGAGTATLDTSGKLVITSGVATRGIAINVNNSAVTVVGAETRNFGHFFGLNDFVQGVTDKSDYNSFISSQQANSTTAVGGTSGTLTFNISTGSTATQAYVNSQTLDTIAANITANGTLAGAGISAKVVNDGTGRRLVISDGGLDNFVITDSGSLLSDIKMSIDERAQANVMTVRSDISNDPTLTARGILSRTAAVGARGISSGDSSAANAIAGVFDVQQTFNSVGGISGAQTTIAGYAAQILSVQAGLAAEAQSQTEFNQSFLESLQFRSDADSGVNIDEELSNIIILEQAFNASARIISVVDAMFDELFNTVR
ncbi:MAG: flagellar hook-associated protein FlgK [Rhodospirillaceae bacterium]|nr:flagellar hook-associated protein FlgK [Rhodospirillaceae bacterium]